MRLLDDAAQGRDNHFNLLRIVMAILVCVAHGFNIYTNRPVDPDPVVAALYTVGFLALDGFFAFSGFMVTASLLRRASLTEYFAARWLRIFPALIAVTALCALVLGPAVTTLSLSEYFSQTGVALYLAGTGLIALPDLQLPGVFKDFADPGVVNAPIWTLRYELVLYIGLAVAFSLGVLKSRIGIGLLFLAASLGFCAKLPFLGLESGSAFVDHLAHFGFSFAVGATAFMFRDKIVLDWRAMLILILAAYTARHSLAYEPLSIIAMIYFLFWVGYLPTRRLLAYNKLGDYSYGFYIIHWPVMSAVLVFWPQMGPVELIAWSVPATLILSILSWHLLEYHALRKIKPLTAWLDQRLPVQWMRNSTQMAR